LDTKSAFTLGLRQTTKNRDAFVWMQGTSYAYWLQDRGAASQHEVPLNNMSKRCAQLTRKAEAQFVDVFRYKSECRGFDSRWYHWNYSL